MAATNYTVLVNRLRIAANDTATSNPHSQETPTGVRNGTNTTFKLANPNIVAGSNFLSYGATVRSASGFSILDAPTGYITMGAAPDSGATEPFFFDYFHQWFVDADYQTMLDEATDTIGPPLGISAGTDLPTGLYPAQVAYALVEYWNRRASQFANLFASKVTTAESHPETPSQNFGKLATAAQKKADALLLAYWKRNGARNAPASGTISYGISQYTPRR